MLKINPNWLATITILSVFSILWLPESLLITWKVVARLGVCLLICIIFFLITGYKNKKVVVFFIQCSIAILLLGYVHHQPIKLLQLANNIVTLPKKITTEFTVVEIIHQQNYQLIVIAARLQPGLAEQRIYTHWKVPEVVKIGEKWHGELQLRPISSRLNFGGFDRQQWYFAKKITAWANVKNAAKIGHVFSWRQEWLNATFQQTKALSQQGLLLTLGFGERAWLNEQTRQIYQQTNTSHLIAISGLHIGLAMFFGYILARLGQILLPTIRISPFFPILCGLGLALIYAELAGLAIPTLRAIMALFIVYALRLGRVYYTAWQLFLYIVAILLFCDPLMVLSVSFWLSISAVACLILWYQIFPLTLLQWNGNPLPTKWYWFFSLFHLQFGLLWLFTPIQLFIFHGFSLYSFVANLIAVPFFSFVLVPFVLCAMMMQGAAYTWQIADIMANQITMLLSFFQYQWVSINQIYIWIYSILSILSFLWVMKWVYSKQTKKQTTSIIMKSGLSLNPSRYVPIQTQYLLIKLGWVTILIGIVILSYQWDRKTDWRIETLDVGQGLSTLIVKNGKGILYDTGSAWQGGSMAKLEVIPYLQRRGIILEHLILSHDDNDHSGGKKDILAQYPNLTLMTASKKNDLKIDRTFCQQGEQWQWQGLHFMALSPKYVATRAENSDSCVLLVDDGYHKLLLTGDADIAVENKFVRFIEKVDVLQVGHHGSKTSTGPVLVNKIQPTIALISSSRWNPWQHPHPDIIERLMASGSMIYNTAINGQISLRFRHKNIKVTTARSDFSPWYQRVIGREAE